MQHLRYLESVPYLTDAIEAYESIGFRLDSIYPADNPIEAKVSGYSKEIILKKNQKDHSNKLFQIIKDQLEDKITDIEIPSSFQLAEINQENELSISKPNSEIVITQMTDDNQWITGRAGMLYRDLIPSRLGGAIIASHIHIPEGGPVPDRVHYHQVIFQMIFCFHGWVKVVYEDQGEPIILEAGDCVTQPSEIRHRVLEASDNLQVIEIALPSSHMTLFDYDLDLPTQQIDKDREWKDQRFCHHVKANAIWHDSELDGLKESDTGIQSATKGLIEVKLLKTIDDNPLTHYLNHNNGINFNVLLSGRLELSANEKFYNMQAADTFCLSKQLDYQLAKIHKGTEILSVHIK